MKKYLLPLLIVSSVFFAACNTTRTTTTTPTASPLADVDNTMNGTPAPTTSPSPEANGGMMVGGAMMLPDRTILQNAINSDNITTLVGAARAAGLDDTLEGKGPYTVFAPTNAAFDKLPTGSLDTWMKPENKTKLTNLLTFHVVPGSYRVQDLKNGQKLKTVNGQELTVTVQGEQVKVNGAAIIETPDVISSNGVTHVIDTVMIPTNAR